MTSVTMVTGTPTSPGTFSEQMTAYDAPITGNCRGAGVGRGCFGVGGPPRLMPHTTVAKKCKQGAPAGLFIFSKFSNDMVTIKNF